MRALVGYTRERKEEREGEERRKGREVMTTMEGLLLCHVIHHSHTTFCVQCIKHITKEQ